MLDRERRGDARGRERESLEKPTQDWLTSLVGPGIGTPYPITGHSVDLISCLYSPATEKYFL